MGRFILILLLICLTSTSYSATTIIPTDNTQSNLRDAYRLVLQKAAHPWTRQGQVAPFLEVNGRPYYGEVPVLWSMDENHYPGSFIIPDTLSTSGITAWQTSFPDLEYAFSLTFTEQEVTIFVLKSSIADTSLGTCSWEYPYFEQFLVNTLDLKSQVHYQLVNEIEFSQRILDDLLFQSSAKILLIPAFSYGTVTLGQYLEESINQHPRFAAALTSFLQHGGTIYTEGNAAYLLEVAALLPKGTVDLENTIDGIGTDMLATVESVRGTIPPGYSNQLYTSQGPTIHDSLHAVAIFTQVADAEDLGKPAVVLIEDPNLCGRGRMILNVGMPAVGSLVLKNNPQWQWLANALFLAFAERLDLVRSVYVETDSLHPDPMSLPAGVETMFEVPLQLHNLWNRASGELQVVEHYKPYFDYVDVIQGPAPMVDETNHTLTFNLNTLSAHQREIITYRLRSPGQDDERVEHIDEYLDHEINMKVSSAEFSFGDPIFNDKTRNMVRDDLWVRFLFEARIVADLDLNWKNILGHYYQPFKIFTTMENKERTPAVSTQIVHYVPLDIPVYKTADPLIPIERTPPGQFMDLLRLGGDLDGDAATDGPDVGFDLNSIFPNAASVETVRVFWRNPWTGTFDDYDRDGQVTTDADSDGVYEIIDDDDRLTALKITWKPGLGTETEGTIPGYQFYDPFCYWEIWIDPPDEIQMAIGAAKRDTITFAVTDSIYNLESFYYEHWERWMEHDEQGNVVQTRLVKRRRQDYEGFALVDSSYVLKPDDVDYGWIPKPIRSSVFFLALGGRGPSMTNPLTEYSELSTITYQTIWGRQKETPLRCAYTYYAPLPNPLQFEYISKTFHITDPETGARLYELPAHRTADLTFDITISTEYSLYWITQMTPDLNGDGLGDGIYSYVIEQIPKGLGGYSVDLPRTQSGDIDTQAVADPPPTAIWEGPFYWQIYWDSLRIPAALDDDNGDGIDDWLDDTGDRFFNPVDSAYLYDAFPPGAGEWLPGPDGEYGDDLCEALGAKTLKVYATFHGQGREGSLKINDGAWLVNEEIFGGPPWVQFSHVQEAWAVGHQIQLRGKPDPTFINLHQNPVYEKFYLTDASEPHTFDILFDPWLKSYGAETATATVYLGGKDPCHQINPDVTLPARLNRTNIQTLTFFPGVDPADFPGYPKQGRGLFVQAIVELNNNEKVEAVFDTSGHEIGHCAKTHWYNVTVTPNLLGLGNTEIFVSYCAYPRPLVPGDDFRTLRAGWRFNPSPMEVLIKMGNPDGSATIPEIQSSRRGYFVFTFKIDPMLPDGCYRIPFTLQGTARAYYDSTGGVPLSFPIPEARFSLSDGSLQPFIIGEAEITDIRDEFKSYVNFGPTPDVRWTEGSEPTEATFNALPMATAFRQDTTLVIRPPILKFPSEQGPVDTDFWLVAHSLVDVPNAGENIPLDTGLRLSYK
ncbi:MAG: hypothetical protein ONB05_06250, partial [candidate division KSB1 bacterium]|nr:hypothetical protein [candidate division KSB1 bacterium]